MSDLGDEGVILARQTWSKGLRFKGLGGKQTLAAKVESELISC